MPLVQHGQEFQVSNAPELDAQQREHMAQLLLMIGLHTAASTQAPRPPAGNLAQTFLTILDSNGTEAQRGPAVKQDALRALPQDIQRVVGSLLHIPGLIPGAAKLFGKLGIPAGIPGRVPIESGPDAVDAATLAARFGAEGAGEFGLGIPGTFGGGVDGATLAAQFGAEGAGEFGLGLPGGGVPGLTEILSGVGALAALGSGIFDLTQGNIPRGAGTLGGAALGAAVGSLFPGVGSLLGAALGGGSGGLIGSLFGGNPGIFEARRANVGPTVTAGQGALTQGIQQGLQGGTLTSLMAGLGAQTPDTFGSSRNPVAVSLTSPQGTFEFNPSRGGQQITPQIFSDFLDEVRSQIPAFQAQDQLRRAEFAKATQARQAEQAAWDVSTTPEALGLRHVSSMDEGEAFFDAEGNRVHLPDFLVGRLPDRPLDLPGLPLAFPPALSRIGGSGDVAFLEQGAAESLAASVATTARQAILDFLLAGSGGPPILQKMPPGTF